MKKEPPIRLLLVEDDDVDALTRFLERQRRPYSLKIVTSQEEALKALSKDSFDIVLLDYDLITATGLDILPAIKDTPSIIITGSEEIAVNAMRKGASDYLIKDPAGNYLTLLPISIRNAQERKQNEDLLNKFMDSATESFLLLDANLDIVKINRQALDILGKTRRELIGKNLVEINPVLRSSERYESYLNVLRTGEPFTEEDFSFNSPVYGRMFGIVKAFKVGEGLGLIVFDTTKRRKLEEQLRQAQKLEAIGSLAGGIAHDFNNILGIIIGYTELAIEDTVDGHHARENLNQVLNAAGRARETVRQILTFSRKDGAHQDVALLADILKNALALIEPSLPAAVQLSADIPPSLPPVLADIDQIRQVIFNVCTNATQAMQAKGGVLETGLLEIEVTPDSPEHDFLEPGPYQCLYFNDSGRGMKPEVVRRIFEPYYTTREQGEGTGMGLAVAHGILKNHGGDITVQSEPGKGTSVHLYFPTTIPERHGETTADEDPATSRFRPLVLLVDDEPPLVQMGRQMLEKLGYRVITRGSGNEALEAFRSDPRQFDIVVSDQTMPHMTGIQLTAELRAIRPDIPVILCTGFSEHIDEEHFAAKGINGFVMKPILKDDLHQKIQTVLARKE